MAGKTRTVRVVDGQTEKRCSAPDHPGERWTPIGDFDVDSTQPSGRRSQCAECYNERQRARRDPEVERKRNRAQRAENSAKADAATERQLGRERARAAQITALAEREAAARRRRLESDVDQLRPDDFGDDEDYDTSIANEKSSSGLSRQASAEKRQEFSRGMAVHAQGVRRAAVAEASGRGDLIGDMPAESGSYVGKLAEQERRFGNRRLARSLSLFAAGEEQARRLWKMACDQYLTGRVVASGFAMRPARAKIKRSVCLLLSDLHLGADLSQADNPMPFRQVEEARRLEYVLRQAIDYKPQYRNDSELVVLFNGDLIEGLLMHDFRDGAPLTEQKVVFQRYFERFVAECARAYPRVRVECQAGNHGRDRVRHPGRATSSKWDGHECGMYYALARACSNLKNVSWSIPFRAISKVELHGQYLLLTHADTEVKVGDPDTKAKDNRAIIDKINATHIYGPEEFAAAAFGHYHKPRWLPGRPQLIFNSALVPPNGHARSSGYIGESCGQFLWEAVEGHIVGDVRFIEVGAAQDRDERLGKLIEPFRFNLDADSGFPVS